MGLGVEAEAAVLVEINPRDLPKVGRPEKAKAKAKTGVAASITTDNTSSAMVTRDFNLVSFIISFGCT
jgi:hypothetical protein